MTAKIASRPAPRRRLQTAAFELFCEQGSAVSTAVIATRAGVSMGTVDSYFGSLDALIESALRLGDEAWFAMLGETLERSSGDAEARILAPFDLLAAGVPNHRYHGRLLAASMTDPAGPADAAARRVLREQGHRMADPFARLAADAGAHDPALLAQQLLLLFVGVTANGLVDPTARRRPDARSAAESLVRQAAVRPAPSAVDSLLRAAA